MESGESQLKVKNFVERSTNISAMEANIIMVETITQPSDQTWTYTGDWRDKTKGHIKAKIQRQ